MRHPGQGKCSSVLFSPNSQAFFSLVSRSLIKQLTDANQLARQVLIKRLIGADQQADQSWSSG